MPVTKTSIMTLEEFLAQLKASFSDAQRRLLDYQSIITSFQALERAPAGALQRYLALASLQKSVGVFLAQHPPLVSSVVGTLATQVDNAVESSLETVPENLHFVWIGALGEAQTAAMDLWVKKNPQYAMHLWYDPTAVLAPVLKKQIRGWVMAQFPAVDPGGQAIERIANGVLPLQNEAWAAISQAMAQGATFDQAAMDFMESRFGMSREGLEETRQANLATYTDFMARLKTRYPKADLRLENIQEMVGPDSGSELAPHYARELGLRGNLAGASDLARLEILKARGGVYMDPDLLPRINPVVFAGMEGEIEAAARLVASTNLKQLKAQGKIQEVDAETLQELMDVGRREVRLALSEYVVQVLGRKDPDFSPILSDAGGNRFRKMTRFLGAKGMGGFMVRFQNVVDNLSPEFLLSGLGEVRVPPGAIFSGLSDLGEMNNAMMAAVAGSSYVSGVMAVILENYQRLEKAGAIQVGSLREVHKAMLSLFTAREGVERWDYFIEHMANYRLDGIVKHAMSTAYVSGPYAVGKGVRKASMAAQGIVDLPVDISGIPGDPVYRYSVQEEHQIANRFTAENATSSWLHGLSDVPGGFFSDTSQYAHTLVIQLDNSASSQTAARYLYQKHSTTAQWVSVGKTGAIQVQAGKAFAGDGPLRVVLVGHGNGQAETIGGRTVSQAADILARTAYLVSGKIERISLVGCELDSEPESPSTGFAGRLLKSLASANRGVGSVSVRSNLLQVDPMGRKWTGALNDDGSLTWSQKDPAAKSVYRISTVTGQVTREAQNISQGQVIRMGRAPDGSGILHQGRMGVSRSLAAQGILDTPGLIPPGPSPDLADFLNLSTQGPLLTTATTDAVLAAMAAGTEPVVVADDSPAQLEGVRMLMLMAWDADSLDEFVDRVREWDPLAATALEIGISAHGELLDLNALKARVETDAIDFYAMDFLNPDSYGQIRMGTQGPLGGILVNDEDLGVYGLRQSGDPRVNVDGAYRQWGEKLLSLASADAQVSDVVRGAAGLSLEPKADPADYPSLDALVSLARSVEARGLMDGPTLDRMVLAYQELIQNKGTDAESYGRAYLTRLGLNQILSADSQALAGTGLEDLPALLDSQMAQWMTPVEDGIHFVWIGKVGAAQKAYIQQWMRANPDRRVTLWYDPEAVLAKALQDAIKAQAAADTDAYTGPQDRDRYRIQRILALQDGAHLFIESLRDQGASFDQGAARYMVDHLGKTAAEVEALRQANLAGYTQLETDLGGGSTTSNFSLTSVDDLWHWEGARNRQYYDLELSLRGSLPAVSDILRYEILRKEGGVYLDADALPATAADVFAAQAGTLAQVRTLLEENGRANGVKNPKDWADALVDLALGAVVQQALAQRGLFPENLVPEDRITELETALEGSAHSGITAQLQSLAQNHSGELLASLDGLRVVPDGIFVNVKLDEDAIGADFIAAPRGSRYLDAISALITHHYDAVEKYGAVRATGISDLPALEKVYMDLETQGVLNPRIGMEMANYRLSGLLAHADSNMVIAGTRALLLGIVSLSRFFLGIRNPQEDPNLVSSSRAISNFLDARTEESLDSDWLYGLPSTADPETELSLKVEGFREALYAAYDELIPRLEQLQAGVAMTPGLAWAAEHLAFLRERAQDGVDLIPHVTPDDYGAEVTRHLRFTMESTSVLAQKIRLSPVEFSPQAFGPNKEVLTQFNSPIPEDQAYVYLALAYLVPSGDEAKNQYLLRFGRPQDFESLVDHLANSYEAAFLAGALADALETMDQEHMDPAAMAVVGEALLNKAAQFSAVRETLGHVSPTILYNFGQSLTGDLQSRWQTVFPKDGPIQFETLLQGPGSERPHSALVEQYLSGDLSVAEFVDAFKAQSVVEQKSVSDEVHALADALPDNGTVALLFANLLEALPGIVRVRMKQGVQLDEYGFPLGNSDPERLSPADMARLHATLSPTFSGEAYLSPDRVEGIAWASDGALVDTALDLPTHGEMISARYLVDWLTSAEGAGTGFMDALVRMDGVESAQALSLLLEAFGETPTDESLRQALLDPRMAVQLNGAMTGGRLSQGAQTVLDALRYGQRSRMESLWQDDPSALGELNWLMLGGRTLTGEPAGVANPATFTQEPEQLYALIEKGWITDTVSLIEPGGDAAMGAEDLARHRQVMLKNRLALAISALETLLTDLGDELSAADQTGIQGRVNELNQLQARNAQDRDPWQVGAMVQNSQNLIAEGIESLRKLRVGLSVDNRELVDTALDSLDHLVPEQPAWQRSQETTQAVADIMEEHGLTPTPGAGLVALLDELAAGRDRTSARAIDAVQQGLVDRTIDLDLFADAVEAVEEKRGRSAAVSLLSSEEGNQTLSRLAAQLHARGDTEGLERLEELLPDLLYAVVQLPGSSAGMPLDRDAVSPEWVPGDTLAGYAAAPDPTGEYVIYTRTDAQVAPVLLPERFAMVRGDRVTQPLGDKSLPLLGVLLPRESEIGQDDFQRDNDWVAENLAKAVDKGLMARLAAGVDRLAGLRGNWLNLERAAAYDLTENQGVRLTAEMNALQKSIRKSSTARNLVTMLERLRREEPALFERWFSAETATAPRLALESLFSRIIAEQLDGGAGAKALADSLGPVMGFGTVEDGGQELGADVANRWISGDLTGAADRFETLTAQLSLSPEITEPIANLFKDKSALAQSPKQRVSRLAQALFQGVSQGLGNPGISSWSDLPPGLDTLADFTADRTLSLVENQVKTPVSQMTPESQIILMDLARFLAFTGHDTQAASAFSHLGSGYVEMVKGSGPVSVSPDAAIALNRMGIIGESTLVTALGRYIMTSKDTHSLAVWARKGMISPDEAAAVFRKVVMDHGVETSIAFGGPLMGELIAALHADPKNLPLKEALTQLLNQARVLFLAQSLAQDKQEMLNELWIDKVLPISMLDTSGALIVSRLDDLTPLGQRDRMGFETEFVRELITPKDYFLMRREVLAASSVTEMGIPVLRIEVDMVNVDFQYPELISAPLGVVEQSSVEIEVAKGVLNRLMRTREGNYPFAQLISDYNTQLSQLLPPDKAARYQMQLSPSIKAEKISLEAEISTTPTNFFSDSQVNISIPMHRLASNAFVNSLDKPEKSIAEKALVGMKRLNGEMGGDLGDGARALLFVVLFREGMGLNSSGGFWESKTKRNTVLRFSPQDLVFAAVPEADLVTLQQWFVQGGKARLTAEIAALAPSPQDLSGNVGMAGRLTETFDTAIGLRLAEGAAQLSVTHGQEGFNTIGDFFSPSPETLTPVRHTMGSPESRLPLGTYEDKFYGVVEYRAMGLMEDLARGPAFWFNPDHRAVYGYLLGATITTSPTIRQVALFVARAGELASIPHSFPDTFNARECERMLGRLMEGLPEESVEDALGSKHALWARAAFNSFETLGRIFKNRSKSTNLILARMKEKMETALGPMPFDSQLNLPPLASDTPVIVPPADALEARLFAAFTAALPEGFAKADFYESMGNNYVTMDLMLRDLAGQNPPSDFAQILSPVLDILNENALFTEDDSIFLARLQELGTAFPDHLSVLKANHGWLADRLDPPQALYTDGSRYDTQWIIQLGDGAGVGNTAQALFDKQPNRSRLLVWDGENFTNKAGVVEALGGHSRLVLVGHGTADTIAGMDSRTVADLLTDHDLLASGDHIGRISFVGCHLASADDSAYLSSTFSEGFLDRLAQAGVTTDGVAVRSGYVRVDAYGRKWTGTLNPDGTVFWQRHAPGSKVIVTRAEDGSFSYTEAPLAQGELIRITGDLENALAGEGGFRAWFDRGIQVDAQGNSLRPFDPGFLNGAQRQILLKELGNNYSGPVWVENDLFDSLTPAELAPDSWLPTAPIGELIDPVPEPKVDPAQGIREKEVTALTEQSLTWNRLADRAEAAIVDLLEAQGLSDHWLPDFDSVVTHEDGSYTLRFINTEDMGDIREVTTSDNDLKAFLDALDENIKKVAAAYTLDDNNRLKPRPDPTEAEAVDGLNSAFMVQYIMSYVQQKQREGVAGSNVPHNLAVALQVHNYVMMAQLAHGAVMDGVKIVKLIKSLIAPEAEVGSSAVSTFAKAFGHVAGEGLGVVFGLANVALDAYQISQATNSSQRAVFGSQLAFDSAGLVMSAAGIIAGVAGAATAASIIGGAGAIVAGVGIGVAGLVQAYEEVSAETQAIGKVFDQIYSAYNDGPFTYDADKDMLQARPGGVVDEIDFRNSGGARVKFGSQTVAAMDISNTHVVSNDWLIGNEPQTDYSHNINVRERWNFDEYQNFDHSDAAVLVLPVNPSAHFSHYDFNQSPHIWTDHYPGYDALRALEGTGDNAFLFDFYLWPTSYAISDISMDYQKGHWLDVKLDDRDRTIAVPDIPDDMAHSTSFRLYGSGGTYTFLPNKNTHDQQLFTDGNTPSTWIISAESLSRDSLSLEANRILLGGESVDIHSHATDTVLVLNKTGGLWDITLGDNPVKYLIHQDATQHADLLTYLYQVYTQGGLKDGRTRLSNYTDADGYSYDTVYYDGGSNTIFHNPTWSGEVQSRSALVAVDGQGRGYFLDAEGSLIRVLSNNWQEAQDQFLLPFGDRLGSFNRAVVKDGALWVEGQFTTAENGTATLQLRLDLSTREWELTSITGDAEFLADMVQWPRSTFMGNLSGSLAVDPVNDPLNPGTVAPELAHWVVVKSDTDLLWYRSEDHTPVHLNIDALPHASASTPTRVPADLALVAVLKGEDGGEIFGFYSHAAKSFFLQQGALGQGEDAVQWTGGVEAVALGDNSVILTETGGRIRSLTPDGETTLVGYTTAFLNANGSNWANALKSDAATQGDAAGVLAVQGVKDTLGLPLAVWYDLQAQGMVISDLNQGRDQLDYLGLDQAGRAMLYDTSAKRLYTQTLLSSEEMSSLFVISTEVVEGRVEANGVGMLSFDPQDANAIRLPAAVEIFPGETIESISRAGSAFQVTTNSHKIFALGGEVSPRLIGVAPGWVDAHINEEMYGLNTLRNAWMGKMAQSLVVFEADGSTGKPRIFGWYETGVPNMISVHQIPAGISDPIWLASRRTAGASYFVDRSNHSLWQIIGNTSVKLGDYAYIDKVLGGMPDPDDVNDKTPPQGDVLLIQGGSGADTIGFPPMDGVFSVVLAGEGGADRYEISEDAWDWVRTVVIDNAAADAVGDRLALAPEINTNRFFAGIEGKDLVLTDDGNAHRILFKNAMAGDRDALHLTIEYGQGLEITLAEIHDTVMAVTGGDGESQAVTEVFGKSVAEEGVDAGESPENVPKQVDTPQRTPAQNPDSQGSKEAEAQSLGIDLSQGNGGGNSGGSNMGKGAGMFAPPKSGETPQISDVGPNIQHQVALLNQAVAGQSGRNGQGDAVDSGAGQKADRPPSLAEAAI